MKKSVSMLDKLCCRLFGHPAPGESGKFLAPIPYRQPLIAELPHLDENCPRCGAALRLHFLPGTRGTNTQAHSLALVRWNQTHASQAGSNP